MQRRLEGSPGSRESLAPRAGAPARDAWIRQYAAVVLVLGGVYEVGRLAAAPALGFATSEAIRTTLYVGLLVLTLAKAPPRAIGSYILGAFALGEALALVETGFSGVSSLLLCAVPVLTALFFGGTSSYVALWGGLCAFVLVGALRVERLLLPPVDERLVDPTRFVNWIVLALAMACVVGPTVWLIGRVTEQLQALMTGLERARTLHSAQVHLRVAAEQALEKAASRRDRARQVEVAGLVIGGVVHDLRNSLGVLQLWSGSLRDEPAADEGVRTAAQRIEGWCGQAAELTRELMAMSRQPRAADAVCPVCTQADAAVSMLQRTLPEDIAVVAERTVRGDLRVAFDAAALTSVILGLAASARLGPGPGSEIRVVVREPAEPERESLADCAAVVELVFGTPSTLLADSALADEVADQGGRLFFDEFAKEESASVRLLLPAARQATPLEEAIGGNAR